MNFASKNLASKIFKRNTTFFRTPFNLSFKFANLNILQLEMSVLRDTYYKDINYWTMTVYFIVVIFSFLLTILLLFKFYLKMRKQKSQMSKMLKVYQFTWIIFACFNFVSFSLRLMEIIEFSGLFFELI